MRDLGFDAVVNLSLTAPGMPGRLRIAGDDPRAEPIVVSNPLSLDHSALRTTLLGSLLDAAQLQRRPRGGAGCALRVGPCVLARG